tara:strand:+ start:8 stop:199 length:192 start_codon:yes stop_codon:yes gene_type:complete
MYHKMNEGGMGKKRAPANMGMYGMGMKREDEDITKARQRKAMGGGAGSQPSYGSGEMPKAMPN